MDGRRRHHGRRGLIAALVGIVPAGLVGAARAQSLGFESVIVDGTAVGSVGYDQSFRVVVLDADRLATLSDLDGFSLQGVVYHHRSGSSWTHAAMAVSGDTSFGGSQTFGEFSSLSLAGSTPRLTFVSESSGGFGLYQRDIGGSSFAVFEAGGGQSLVTRSGLVNIRTAVNAGGDVLFGKVAGSTQSLERGNGASVSTLLTSGVDRFNETNDFTPELPIKRVITSAGVAVGLGRDTSTLETAIYDFDAATAAVRVVASTTEGGKTYRPRQVLGASVANTLFVADVDGDASVGRVVYQVGSGGTGNYRPVGTEFTIDGSKKPGGTMTANGNAAFYVPRTDGSSNDDSSIYFYEPTLSSPAELRQGDTVGSFTLDAIGAAGNETAPMVNDAGWVVFDATITGGVLGSGTADAVIAWQPSANLKLVVAYVGGTISIDGNASTVTGFTSLPPADPTDVDPFKDALGDDSRLALALTWQDDDLNPFAGVVMVNLNSAVPEPASLVTVASLALLLRRRRAV